MDLMEKISIYYETILPKFREYVSTIDINNREDIKEWAKVYTYDYFNNLVDKEKIIIEVLDKHELPVIRININVSNEITYVFTLTTNI